MSQNIDSTALYKLGYGLYVVTTNDGTRDNGLIVNTVMQVTSGPDRIAVAINKSNYSHDVVRKTGKMTVNCLTEAAPFKVFEVFGFQSGRDVNKFADCTPQRGENGLVILPKYINAAIELAVEQYTDLGSHGLFVCGITASKTLSNEPSMTYAYYHANVKPKPAAKSAEQTGYICKICGYVYEGDPLPEDFICPLCKHGAADFEKLGETQENNKNNQTKQEDGTMKYVCGVCGWAYDETVGDPDNGIAPGTKFEDLPESFACPLCGVGKDQFEQA